MTPELTEYVALYGAVLSTAALGLSGYIALVDRPIAALRGALVTAASMASDCSTKPLGQCVQLTVSNKGRRPMNVISAGWSAPDGNHRVVLINPARPSPLLSHPPLPHALGESESCSFRWPLEAFADARNRPVKFFVTDSHNKNHFLSRRRTKRLVKSVVDALKESAGEGACRP